MDGRAKPAGGHMRTLAAVCVGSALLAAGGCASAVNPGTPLVPAPQASATPATVSSALSNLDGFSELTPPPFPAGLDPATAEPSTGALLTVTDVRVDHHDGFDRVVYEMDGVGRPGWTVGYVSQAVQDGSGMLLNIEGPATLWVAISGSAYPSDTGAVPFTHQTSMRGDGTTVVTEVEGWSPFEGITGSYVGVAEPRASFRVFLLEDPVRVVVDLEEPQP